MSNFSGHAKAGIAVSALSLAGTGYMTVNIELSLMVASATFIGSLFPDLDIDSIPSRWAARVSFVVILLSWYKSRPEIGLAVGAGFTLLKSGKHRGFTHKYGLPVILLISTIWFQHLAILGFLAGLITHYALDSMSPFKLKNWI